MSLFRFIIKYYFNFIEDNGTTLNGNNNGYAGIPVKRHNTRQTQIPSQIQPPLMTSRAQAPVSIPSPHHNDLQSVNGSNNNTNLPLDPIDENRNANRNRNGPKTEDKYKSAEGMFLDKCQVVFPI